ncbi:hypothetical protein [Halosimplex pelagicum]|uniref:Uncharacterized protein n=1 Tax=Halosimplex pelagicum TaxID=869886 RepID=A0A7D5P7P4_9EURY|nr:hypothetical protein [Halosimplex pelagicum]QLH81281.1 hypothetical protein HZS54_06375 [Halosimplex pelagicum]
MRIRAVVCLGILLSAVAAFGVAAAAEDVSGVAIEIHERNQQQLLNQQLNWTARLDVQPRSNVFALDAGEMTYLVFTDKRPETARASVSGPTLPLNARTQALFAESASFNYDGQSVPISSLDQGAHDGQLVETQGSYRHFPMALDLSGTTQPGLFGTVGADQERLAQPGRTVRAVLFNQRNSSLPTPVVLQSENQSASAIAYGDRAWYTGGESQVTLASSDYSGSQTYYTSQVRQSGERIGSVSEIGDDDVGDVVTVTASATGARLSAQETMAATSSCEGENTVEFPFSGCEPLRSDTVIHTGALWDSSSGASEDTVRYVGLSNTVQQTPTMPESGRYRLTGRVVEAEQIDPNLDPGHTLVVYNRSRVGDVDVPSQADQSARTMELMMRGQLTMNISQWQTMAGMGQLTPPDFWLLVQKGPDTVPDGTTPGASGTTTAQSVPTVATPSSGSDLGDTNNPTPDNSETVGRETPPSIESDGSGDLQGRAIYGENGYLGFGILQTRVDLLVGFGGGIVSGLSVLVAVMLSSVGLMSRIRGGAPPFTGMLKNSVWLAGTVLSAGTIGYFDVGTGLLVFAGGILFIGVSIGLKRLLL